MTKHIYSIQVRWPIANIEGNTISFEVPVREGDVPLVTVSQRVAMELGLSAAETDALQDELFDEAIQRLLVIKK
jgi:hypothetical protein